MSLSTILSSRSHAQSKNAVRGLQPGASKNFKSVLTIFEMFMKQEKGMWA